MKAYLIDDEPYCTDVLGVLLEKYCPEVQVAAVFQDPELALNRILADPPELLFIDIEMPVLNGFDLLQRCGDFNFKVIFTTAYDQYAVRAFKFNALDYLLKPIEKDDLIAALAKAKKAAAPSPIKMEAVRNARESGSPERIALPVGQELILVDVKNIIYCESEGSYVRIFMEGESKAYMLSKSLREIEELLNNPSFFRSHHSYLINLKKVSKILRAEGGELIMNNGKSVPVARAKKADLLTMFAKL